MTNQILRLIILTATVVATAVLAGAQTNLLQNPNADLQSQFWHAYGTASGPL